MPVRCRLPGGIIAAVIALAGLAACSGDIYLRDGVTDGDTFFLSPVAMANPDPVVQSWIRYSLTRSVCQLELGGDNPARASSFDCELKAREQLLGAWREHCLEDPALRDDYLDALVRVGQAGYLREYIASHLSRGHWRLPEVDVAAYQRWRRAELPSHRPQTRIIGSWGYRNSKRSP